MEPNEIDFRPYSTLWIAQTEINGQVVGTGHTGVEAYLLARRNHPKLKLIISYVPDMSGKRLTLSPLLETIQPALARVDVPIYLVGGAVRDAVLGKESNDLDFVVPKNGIQIAFQIGDFLGAPAYPLDKSRDVGRVVLKKDETYLDIAAFRSDTLEGDLFDRDFTLNAMAIPALAKTTAELIDPTNGLEDMQNQVVRAVHDQSLQNDPLRVLRGIRMAMKVGYEIDDATQGWMSAALDSLAKVSNERIRDEVLNMFAISPSKALESLNALGFLKSIFPDLADLNGVEQSAPHFEPVLDHSIRVVRYLEQPPNILKSKISPSIQTHLDRDVAGGMSGVQLLILSGIFHDVGKAQTKTVDEDGRIRFFGHAEIGAEKTANQLRTLKMSAEAIKEVSSIVDGHMRPLLFAQQISKGEAISVKARHRFWKKYGDAGLDICLLSLADHFATYHNAEPEVQKAALGPLLEVIEGLLAHYESFEKPGVKQAPLLTGDEIMKNLQIPAGPEIGRLLRLLAEAQVSGEVTSQEEALTYLQSVIH